MPLPVRADGAPFPVVAAALAWQAVVGPVVLDGAAYAGVGGSRVESAPALMPVLAVPGLACKDLICPDGARWTVTAADTANGAATAADLADVIGSDAVAFLAALSDLWTKAAGSGFWTDFQMQKVHAAIACGVVCYPANERTVQQLAPGLAPALVAPPFRSDEDRARYAAIVAAFKAVLSSYLRRQYTLAAAAARASASDVAFWDSMHAVVAAVAEAPAAIAGAVSDAVVGVAGGVLARAWPLLLIAAAAAGLWFFWPSLAGAALAHRGKAAA